MQHVVAAPEGYWIADPELLELDGAEVRRSGSAVVPGAVVHQTEAAPQASGLATAAVAVRVVQVLQAQGVGEFVAEGAKAGELGAHGETDFFHRPAAYSVPRWRRQ